MIPAVTQHVDWAQLSVIVFFVFFGGLVFHLRREDKREGFPLEPDLEGRRGEMRRPGFPWPPAVKVFALLDGTTSTNPNDRFDEVRPASRPLAGFPGAPLVPIGPALQARLGPGAVGWKRDEPLRTWEDVPQVQPLRVAREWSVAAGDCDPRGMTVLGADRVPVGTVAELWVDRSVKILRYLEVALSTGGTVLLPIYFCDIRERPREIRVRAILGRQFAEVPRPASPDQITGREEDFVNAFYAAGLLFARPRRAESLLWAVVGFPARSSTPRCGAAGPVPVRWPGACSGRRWWRCTSRRWPRAGWPRRGAGTGSAAPLQWE